MEELKVITREEAFKRKYLENRKVIFKLIPKPSAMIKDPKHKGYGIWEEASISFQLPMKAAAQGGRGELINPFKDEDEQKFFENIFNADMNVYKIDNNYWHKYRVAISATGFFKDKGYVFDLSDPRANIDYRIAQLQTFTCKEGATPMYHQRFMLVSENFVEEQVAANIDKELVISSFFVKIAGSDKKMKEFLTLYGMEYKHTRTIPSDANSTWLKTEISKLTKSKDDMNKMYNLIKDEDVYNNKVFLYRALKAGIIARTSTNQYRFEGGETYYTYEEMYKHLMALKDEGSQEYLKIETLIKQYEKAK